ncbi:MAG TPA: 2-dehydropantoate 2-reductase [Burkholderiaceae bacterium]|nr:2-dehydropantoate 2-reductase [Burkholderiaceae bacterium]
MKTCIYGAGAIGGLIGTRLALYGGVQVSALARGATLLALRQHGWRLRQGGKLLQAGAHASDHPAELGPQDLLVIAVKGPAMAEVARRIGPLLKPETIVLPAMNGVPWWFCEGLPGIAGASALESVDPGGFIAQAIPVSHVIGCVVHAAAAMPEPGLVEHRMGHGLIIGEPQGNETPRVQRLRDLLTGAGFEVTLSDRIRRDTWYKLWGNLTMNPVSAVTGASADRILDDPLVREFCSASMREAAAIGALLGCAIEQTPEERHAVTRKLGTFKTSMLQDVEAGRMLELDAIVGAVRELGQRVGVATPNIDTLFGLARLFARVRGLYPG